MLKKIVFLLYVCFVQTAFANVCIEYKQAPNVTVKNPEPQKHIVLSDDPMDEYHGKYFSFKLHGITQANLILKYQIECDFIRESDGFCIRIKNLDTTIGYENIDIKIDKSHKKNSCSYNAVLKHEEKHVDAYLSVLRDLSGEIENAVYNAANSIMPEYASNYTEIDDIIEGFNNKIKNHPDLKLIIQKIQAAEEIRNKRIDQEETGEDLKKCS